MAVQLEQEVVAKEQYHKTDMKRKGIIYILIALIGMSFTIKQSLSDLLKKYNTESIPYIYQNGLSTLKNKKHLLDSREPKEYKVSHLEEAILVGYDHFDIKTVTDKIKNKQDTIVVYCSLGIRSETIGEQVKAAGYKNVYNLYGGIFEWKNHDHKVYDSNGEETEKVHAFSKEWGTWLKKGDKVYD